MQDTKLDRVPWRHFSNIQQHSIYQFLNRQRFLHRFLLFPCLLRNGGANIASFVVQCNETQQYPFLIGRDRRHQNAGANDVVRGRGSLYPNLYSVK